MASLDQTTVNVIRNLDSIIPRLAQSGLTAINWRL